MKINFETNKKIDRINKIGGSRIEDFFFCKLKYREAIFVILKLIKQKATKITCTSTYIVNCRVQDTVMH